MTRPETIDDIFDRPTIEDCVYYTLYIQIPSSISSDNDTKKGSYIQDQCLLINSFISQWTHDYIWHKDPFTLAVSSENKTSLDGKYGVIKGQTRFSDNIEDEWFIVWLIFEITKKFEGVIASIHDSDGDFLLIEAADYIPKWLSPTTSKNRIFIASGLLQIVPFPKTPAEIPILPSGNSPNLLTCLGCVSSETIDTVARKEIQASLLERIGSYPDSITENDHYARVYVPHSIAHILNLSPKLVAPVVEAFYYRDPVSLKVCSTMKNFKPVSPASPTSSVNKIVQCTIRFTKALYAQLSHQEFLFPPPILAVMPNENSIGRDVYRQWEIGMKLVCGFEMLLANAPADDSDVKTGAADNNDAEWNRVLKRLERMGYFRDSIPGSKLYTHLHQLAKTQFESTTTSSSSSSSLQPDSHATQIRRILLDCQTQPEHLIPPSSLSQRTPDSEEWLEVDPKALEEMLLKKMGVWNDADTDVTDGEKSVEGMLSKVKDFLRQKSGVEGIDFSESDDEDEFYRMGGSDDEDDEDDDDMMDEMDSEEEERMMRELGFDEKQFMKLFESMMMKGGNEGMSAGLEEFSDDEDEDDDYDEDEAGLEDYMNAMDAELSKAEKLSLNVPLPETTKKQVAVNSGADIDKEVQLDFNVVSNLLESFGAQEGLPGPSGNLLRGLGVGVGALGDNEEEK